MQVNLILLIDLLVDQIHIVLCGQPVIVINWNPDFGGASDKLTRVGELLQIGVLEDLLDCYSFVGVEFETSRDQIKTITVHFGEDVFPVRFLQLRKQLENLLPEVSLQRLDIFQRRRTRPK